MPRIVSTLEFAMQSKDRMWQMMTRVYEQAARVINERVNHGSGWNCRYFDPRTNLLITNHDQPKCRDNIQGAIVYCTFSGADADTLIQHNLGYIPRCYIPLWKAVACDVYDGTGTANPLQPNPTPAYVGPGLGIVLSDAATRPDGTSPYTSVTTSTIILRCTAATNVLLLIF